MLSVVTPLRISATAEPEELWPTASTPHWKLPCNGTLRFRQVRTCICNPQAFLNCLEQYSHLTPPMLRAPATTRALGRRDNRFGRISTARDTEGVPSQIRPQPPKPDEPPGHHSRPVGIECQPPAPRRGDEIWASLPTSRFSFRLRHPKTVPALLMARASKRHRAGRISGLPLQPQGQPLCCSQTKRRHPTMIEELGLFCEATTD